ncbi:hypothetical protein K227x_13740 [Rubripirellula lacrimiformis]|uniref:Squalene cyclase C-terminal domain-containing protein n=2 Tax=Rubripirellula lacrimiformis TaxID=1930273 RepID=A0A517N791_9BACT|nr:hypothetical protein K227x_13740 [Rubripirellula lacrimiformis]
MTDSTVTTGAGQAPLAMPMVPARAGDRWKEPPPPDPQEKKSDPGEHAKSSRSSSPLVPFLVSTIVHTLLLILLALVTYQSTRGHGKSLVARQGREAVEIPLDSLTMPDVSEIIHDGQRADQPISIRFQPSEPSSTMSPIVSDVAASDLPNEDVPDALSAIGGGQPTALTRLPVVHASRGGLSGRSAEQRKRLGEKYGASGASEDAVENALVYLAAHQRNDGSWSFNLKLDPCNGRCTHSTKGGESPAPSTGATGLALLAFLGAGHTHTGNGPYAETVRKGIYYLRSKAAETEAGYDWQQGSMYGHGIALMALGEALAMTTDEGNERDSDLYELVQRGAQFTCIAQHHGGSWGYYPKSPGDTTVTGWQVLSLIAARRSGVELQTHTLAQAKEFLFSTCTDRDYWFGYQAPPGEPTTTAIGLAIMLYLGERPDYTMFQMALTDMAQRGPTLTNIYHDYYATLALHHARHPLWGDWNVRLRDHLVATQVKSGHEKGSWHFKDKWGDVGGRIYTTAMCALTLEIYYRYLPIHDQLEEFPL